MDVRGIIHKYRILYSQLEPFGDAGIADVQKDIEKEITRLSSDSAAGTLQNAKVVAEKIWSKVNEQLFDQYCETCAGSTLRLQIPAAVGTAMELVRELELLTGGE